MSLMDFRYLDWAKTHSTKRRPYIRCEMWIDGKRHLLKFPRNIALYYRNSQLWEENNDTGDSFEIPYFLNSEDTDGLRLYL